MIPDLTIDLTSTMRPVFTILSGAALGGLAVLVAVLWREERKAARHRASGKRPGVDEAA